MGNDDDKIDPTQHYDMKETARLVFRRKRRWLYRNLQTLTKKAGFPKPVSPVGQRYYSGEALLAWVHRDQSAKLPDQGGKKAAGRLAERVARAEREL